MILETIKEKIAEQYSLDGQQWIFLSCFDSHNTLLSSHGVLVTNKSLWTVIDMIYHGILQTHSNEIKRIIVDIVTEINELNTMDQINNIDITTTWLCISTIDYSKSWVIAPWTQGISSLAQMLQIIKEKNHIEGNVIIHSFHTEKIEIVL